MNYLIYFKGGGGGVGGGVFSWLVGFVCCFFRFETCNIPCP